MFLSVPGVRRTVTYLVSIGTMGSWNLLGLVLVRFLTCVTITLLVPTVIITGLCVVFAVLLFLLADWLSEF